MKPVIRSQQFESIPHIIPQVRAMPQSFAVGVGRRVIMDTAFIDFPAIYNSITNIHFFHSDKRSTVVLKSIGITICLFIILRLTEKLVLKNTFFNRHYPVQV